MIFQTFWILAKANYERFWKLKLLKYDLLLQKRSMSVFRQQRKCNAKSNENYKLSFWLKWMSNSFWEEEKTWMIIESHLESSRKIHLAWTWHFTFATWLFMVAFPIMLYFFLLCKIIIKIRDLTYKTLKSSKVTIPKMWTAAMLQVVFWESKELSTFKAVCPRVWWLGGW